MSESLDRTAEITKLARLLGVDAKELAYLEKVPASGLARFREQVTDRLFTGDGDRLKRVAAASRLIPVPLTAKVAQLAFGPMLCAATAGQLDPPHAVKVASRCEKTFLADVAVALDPRRAPAVIAAVPTELVVAIAKKLIARGEHVTMGRFVSYLRHETLAAAVPEIPDEADLLKVAFVMEGKERLDDLYDIARDRVVALIRTAHEQDLWAEALDLIGHLSLENRAELGDVAATQDDDLLDSLIRAAARVGAWEELLPVIAAMSTDALARLARLPAVLETDVLRDIVLAALEADLWRDLLPLSKHLPDEARRQVAFVAAEQDDAMLEHLAGVAHEAGMWDAMVPIALALPGDVRVRLLGLPLLRRPDVIMAALTAAERSGELDTLIDAALELDPAGRRQVLAVVAELDRLDDVTALLHDATPARVWDALVEIRAELPGPVVTLLVRRASELERDDVVRLLTEGTSAASQQPGR